MGSGCGPFRFAGAAASLGLPPPNSIVSLFGMETVGIPLFNALTIARRFFVDESMSAGTVVSFGPESATGIASMVSLATAVSSEPCNKTGDGSSTGGLALTAAAISSKASLPKIVSAAKSLISSSEFALPISRAHFFSS